MKILVYVVLIFLGASAAAYEKTICLAGEDKEATIFVNHSDNNTRLPCDVNYLYNGRLVTLWSSKDDLNSCADKAAEIAETHAVKWGWQCMPLSEYQPKPATDVLIKQLDPTFKQEIEEYQQAARISEILSLLSSFLIIVREYELDNGQKPTRLEDISLRREDMKNSHIVQDVNLGKDGYIYALGADRLGSNIILKAQNRTTPGGMSQGIECFVNVKVVRFDRCHYDPTLIFPK